MKLTQQRYELMHPAERRAAFLQHPTNTQTQENRSTGPTLAAQAEVWNNPAVALSRFGQTLPRRRPRWR